MSYKIEKKKINEIKKNTLIDKLVKGGTQSVLCVIRMDYH